MFDRVFAEFAGAISAQFGGPYHPSTASWPGVAVIDDGGSIVTPGEPVNRDCSVQVDSATEAMRQAEGYAEKDVRLIVLGLNFLDSDATITINRGPHAGSWSLQSCERDPVAIGWVCRGRQIARAAPGGLSGTLNASSLATAVLSLRVPISGVVMAASGASASLTVRSYIVGTVQASSGLTGALSAGAGFSGAVTAQSSVAATLSLAVGLSGSVLATSSASGALGAGLSGAVLAQSTATGALTTRVSIAGAVTAQAAVAASLRARLPIVGSVVAQSAITGAVTTRAMLFGDVVAASAVIGELSVAEPTPSYLAPTNDWRMPIDDFTDTGASSTFRTAVLASPTAKTMPQRPVGYSNGSSGRYHMAVKVPAVSAPGGIIYVQGGSNAPDGMTMEVNEFYDAALTGAAVIAATTGATNIPYTMFGASGQQATLGNGQLIKIPAGPARWVRVTIVGGGFITPIISAFQRTAAGNEPVIWVVGMSITTGIGLTGVRNSVQSVVPGADPILLTTAVPGQAHSAFMANQINPTVANPRVNDVIRYVVLDGSTNDVWNNNNRPYTGDASDLAIGTNLAEQVDAVAAIVPKSRIYPMDISYGALLVTNPTTGDVVGHPNSFAPYNANVLFPAVKAQNPRAIDAKYDWFAASHYWSIGVDALSQLSDDVHPGTRANLPETSSGASYAGAMAPLFKVMWGGSLSDGGTIDWVLDQIGKTPAPYFKSRLLALYDTLAPTSDTTAQANRTALLARINSIPDFYVEPSVTGSAKLVTDPALATMTLLEQFDIADTSNVARSPSGVTGRITGRIGGATLSGDTVANGNRRPVIVSQPWASDVRPSLDLAGNNQVYLHNFTYTQAGGGPSYVADPDLVGLVDSGASQATFFFVVDLPAVIGQGGDLFTISTATRVLFGVTFPNNSRSPTIRAGDSTGTDIVFQTTVAGAAANSRLVFAVRKDGAAFKFYIAAATQTGITTRTAGGTGNRATLGGAVSNFGVSGGSGEKFAGRVREIAIFTGAGSDAEILTVLDGLRQKHTDSTKVPI